MRKFYETYHDLSNLPPAAAKLPWTHNSILVERISDPDERVWYAEKCIENGWNKVVLDHQIDLNLYQRQSDNSAKLTNFGEHLPTVQGELAQDLIKDPYIFELSGLTERSAERDIEKAMVERIKTVLLEFGPVFAFEFFFVDAFPNRPVPLEDEGVQRFIGNLPRHNDDLFWPSFFPWR